MGMLICSRVLAVTGVGLLSLLLVACDRLGDGPDAPAPEEAKPGQVASTPEPGRGSKPEEAPPSVWIEPSRRPSQDEALEVVRKRLDAEDESGVAVDLATPSPEPSVVLQTRDDGVIWVDALGLMWTREAAGVFASEDTGTYCEGLSLGGHADWRLPNIAELGRILTSGFSPSARSRVRALWSGSRHPVRGTWAFDLASEAPVPLDATVAHVVCVRELE